MNGSLQVKDFQVRLAATGCAILTLVLLNILGCGNDDDPTQVRPGPPTVVVPGTVGASTGVDVRISFSVSDPDHDPIDSVFAVGVWDSVGFEPVTSNGRLIWRACSAGSYGTTIYAIAGGDTGAASVDILVEGGADHYINMIGGSVHFQPESLFVREGETVAWRNLDAAAHNVYELSGAIRIDQVKPGCESKAVSLTASGGSPLPGQYPYYCTLDTLRRAGPCYVIVSP